MLVGGSWGGGDHLYIYIYIGPANQVLSQMLEFKRPRTFHSWIQSIPLTSNPQEDQYYIMIWDQHGSPILCSECWKPCSLHQCVLGKSLCEGLCKGLCEGICKSEGEGEGAWEDWMCQAWEVLHSFTVLADREANRYRTVCILGSKSEDVQTRGQSSFGRRSCDKVYSRLSRR